MNSTHDATASPQVRGRSATTTPFETVLVPINYTEASRRALAAAMELHDRLGARVHLFRLTDWAENDMFIAGMGGDAISPRSLVEAEEERLRRFVDNVMPGRASDVEVSAEVGVDVLHGIVRRASHLSATLVILGEEPRQTLFRTLVEKIAQGLDAAVMVVRTPHQH
jgi:nucleotide-binding universal stress UspA family protein